MLTMTASDYKKIAKKDKLFADWAVAYYGGEESWNQKPLIISDKVSEPTTIHSHGKRKPSCLIIPSDLTREDVIAALFSYVNIGRTAYVTIRNVEDKKVFAVVR